MLSRISFRRPSLALAGILIGIGGCGELPSTPQAPSAQYHFLAAPTGAHFSKSGESSSSAVIGTEGGVLTTSSGHQIVFPAGALAAPTLITITSDESYAGVDLQPHGLRFPSGKGPVLTLNVAGSNLSQYSALNILYVSSDYQIQEILPATVVNGQLRTTLQHFSGYLGAGT